MGREFRMRLINYFHRKVPVDSLCLYRMALGFLICCEAASWLPYTREMLSNDGFHVSHYAWLPVPPPELALLLCLTLVFSSLLMALGLFTRTAIVFTFLSWSYIYGIDSINEKAAQTIVMVVLCFLFFSSCGYRFSLDNYLRRRKGLPEYPAEASIFILTMLRFEFANIYFFCGLAKLTYPEWVNGTTFARLLNCRWATPLGVYLSAFEFDLPARIGGIGTILFELFEGFLLLTPTTRYYAIALGLCFHIGIQMTLYVGSLGFHFILALLLIFPEPELVAKLVLRFQLWLKRAPRREARIQTN